MRIRETLENIGLFMDNEELTMRDMKILIAITLGFLVVGGILAYVLTYLYLGF